MILVEGMIGILLTIVCESVFAKAVKCHASQKASRNDAVRVDVIQQQRNTGAGDGSDFSAGHDGNRAG
jgi:hypothetical protein